MLKVLNEVPSGLHQAQAADLPNAWATFDAATVMLADLTAWDNGGGEVLSKGLRAAAEQILSARLDVLDAVVETHLARLSRFRIDTDACPIQPQLLTARMLQSCPPSLRFRDFQQDSALAHQKACESTLQGLALGAPAEVWVYRLARCVEVEAMIDQCCPQSFNLAGACASTWLERSLPLLPWILAALLVPGGADAAEPLRRLRRALELCCLEAQLAQLRDSLVKACALLSMAAWFQVDPVAWLTSLLQVMHNACQLLLPEVPAGALAAALAPALAPALSGLAELEAPPWETLGLSSIALDVVHLAYFPSARYVDMAESIAGALHDEVMTWLPPGWVALPFASFALCNPL